MNVPHTLTRLLALLTLLLLLLPPAVVTYAALDAPYNGTDSWEGEWQ